MALLVAPLQSWVACSWPEASARPSLGLAETDPCVDDGGLLPSEDRFRASLPCAVGELLLGEVIELTLERPQPPAHAEPTMVPMPTTRTMQVMSRERIENTQPGDQIHVPTLLTLISVRKGPAPRRGMDSLHLEYHIHPLRSKARLTGGARLETTVNPQILRRLLENFVFDEAVHSARHRPRHRRWGSRAGLA